MSNLYSFDESKINWQPLPGVDHARLSILDVDDTAKIVDILFKFSANEKIVLHRHVSAFNTFVVSAERASVYTTLTENLQRSDLLAHIRLVFLILSHIGRVVAKRMSLFYSA